MVKIEMAKKMLEFMSCEALLKELILALSNDQAIDNLEFIARMHDIDLD